MTKLTQNQIVTLEVIGVNGKTSVNDKDVCYRFNLNPRTFKRTVNSLVKRGLLIETKEGFTNFDKGSFFNDSFTFVQISPAGSSIIDGIREAEEKQAEEKQAEEKQAEEKQAEEIQAEEIQAEETTLTELEEKVLKVIYRYDELASDEIAESAGINKNQVGGVVASLLNKDLIDGGLHCPSIFCTKKRKLIELEIIIYTVNENGLAALEALAEEKQAEEVQAEEVQAEELPAPEKNTLVQAAMCQIRMGLKACETLQDLQKFILNFETIAELSLDYRKAIDLLKAEIEETEANLKATELPTPAKKTLSKQAFIDALGLSFKPSGIIIELHTVELEADQNAAGIDQDSISIYHYDYCYSGRSLKSCPKNTPLALLAFWKDDDENDPIDLDTMLVKIDDHNNIELNPVISKDDCEIIHVETQANDEETDEELPAPAKKLPKQLSQSTISKYSVLQIAKHASRYHDKAGLELYRFDFAYGTVYETTGRNSYVPFISLYESSYNRMMIIQLLESIYGASK